MFVFSSYRFPTNYPEPIIRVTRDLGETRHPQLSLCSLIMELPVTLTSDLQQGWGLGCLGLHCEPPPEPSPGAFEILVCWGLLVAQHTRQAFSETQSLRDP